MGTQQQHLSVMLGFTQPTQLPRSNSSKVSRAIAFPAPSLFSRLGGVWEPNNNISQ
ncbi:hypothetical protein NIES39_J04710 [Arthrospira platensis NIES-39]|nr:hypothetical protein NIES39_J04690 [Arthrospira platensis NIES-39]BAI91516.1 hypothetical protein NIES39_J04700 [Arthrospira platensis NIES-39]BAI91517.1 hypothetical protein NIES39_J04710 [Arthrospira platensis NIES-39]